MISRGGKMFERLQGAIKKLTDSIKEKELTEKNLNPILEDFQLNLVSNDVATPVARKLTSNLKEKLVGKRVGRLTDPKEIIQTTLRKKISDILCKNNGDLGSKIKESVNKNSERIKKGEKIKPFKIMFVGPNGAGKTTSIAKIAWKLKQKGITSLFVASDTFRAGAQEQLKKHSEELDLPLIEGEYGKDPTSVGYDAINFAKSKRIPIVLIDTAGRLGGDINLIKEMKKMDKIIEPDMNIFVASALSGNELANQAEQFRKEVGIDGNVLTKVDADVKGGAALTLTYSTDSPIFFIGTGQKYSDLKNFDRKWFIERITNW